MTRFCDSFKRAWLANMRKHDVTGPEMASAICIWTLTVLAIAYIVYTTQ